MEKEIFRLVIQDQNELICRFTKDFELTFVNKAYSDYFTMKTEDLIGLNLLKLLPEKDAQNLKTRLAKITYENPTIIYQYEIISPNGDKRWQEWTNRGVYNKNQTLIAYQSIGRDITKNKKMEQLIILQRDFAYEIMNIHNVLKSINIIMKYFLKIDEIDCIGLFLFDIKNNTFKLIDNKGLTKPFSSMMSRITSKDTLYSFAMDKNINYSDFNNTNWKNDPIVRQEQIQRFCILPQRYKDEVLGFIFIGSHSINVFPNIIENTILTFSRIATSIIIETHQEEQLSNDKKIMQELKERFELSINGANIGTWDWNIVTGDVVFNDNWAEMLGYKLEEIPKTVEFWAEILHPDDMDFVMKELTDYLEGKTEIYKTEHRLKTKDNKWKWILDIGKIFERDKDNKPLRACGIHLDITSEKEKEQKLNLKLELEKILREKSNAFINIASADVENKIYSTLKRIGKFFKADRSYIFEISNDNTMSNTYEWCEEGIESFKDKLQNLPLDVFKWVMNKLLKDETVYIEDVKLLPPEAKNEKDFLIEKNVQSFILVPISYEKKLIGFCGFVSTTGHKNWTDDARQLLKILGEIIFNVLKKMELQRKLEYLSLRDELTGIYNRKFLEIKFKQLREEYLRFNEIFSFAIFDIDNFKTYNDKYGHLFGDFILKQFTNLIKQHLRVYDHFARYGGDEFVIIFPRIDSQQAMQILNRILTLSKENQYSKNGDKVNISFSAGLVDVSEITGEINIEKLYKIADKRLYIAKEQGKGRVISKDHANKTP